MEQQAFMIMPFSDTIANDNYNLTVKPICLELGLDVRRADEIFGITPIYDDILREINDATIIVADITNFNPNVMYELGIAHTLKQHRTIILTQEDFNKLPFDIGHFRVIQYEDSIHGKADLDAKLRATLKLLLMDFKETFKNEFEIIYSAFVMTKPALLVGLIGLTHKLIPVETGDRISYEGRYLDRNTEQNASFAGSWFNPFIEMGYLDVNGEFLQVTEKGVAFASLLEDKGIVCGIFNDELLVEGYTKIKTIRKKLN